MPALRPFVESLWATEDVAPVRFAQPEREHVLPTGSMHLVFRLSDAPLWLLDPDGGPRAQAIGAATVGGTRSRYYMREMTAPSCSVGVVLRPGASELLFGVAADELAETHTPLDDLWGRAARAAHERLCVAGSAAELLTDLESVLLERLPRVHGMHPAVAAMIGRMQTLPSIGAAVEQSGLSHRHFVALFRRAVGLAPKTYARVLRFQSALRVARKDDAPSWAALANAAGYSDQAHFNRDFVEFAGVTPTAYQRVASVATNHVPRVERVRRA
jgi:AraC-like DNA-binding protein